MPVVDHWSPFPLLALLPYAPWPACLITAPVHVLVMLNKWFIVRCATALPACLELALPVTLRACWVPPGLGFPTVDDRPAFTNASRAFGYLHA